MRNWVIDNSGKIDSVFEKLAKRFAIRLDYLAYVSAHVNSEGGRSMLDRVVGTLHFSDQVDRILRLRDFPEIILIWLGHNSLDWARFWVGKNATQSEIISKLAENAIEAYESQFVRLCETASNQHHRVTIVVFALVSFELFFQAREEAEFIKMQDAARYPFLEVDYRYFASMQPPFRKGMIKLANLINSGLLDIVTRARRRFGVRPSTVFSSALHESPINHAEMLSDVDGWHPSLLGHKTLAEHAFPVVLEQVMKHNAHLTT